MRLIAVLAMAVVMTGSRSSAGTIVAVMSLWRILPERAVATRLQRIAADSEPPLPLPKPVSKNFKLVGGADIIVTDKLPLSRSIKVADIPIEPPLGVLVYPLVSQKMILFDLKVWVDYKRHTDKDGHVEYRVRGVYPMSDEQENIY